MVANGKGFAKAARMKLEFSQQTLMAAFAKPLLPAGRFISRNLIK